MNNDLISREDLQYKFDNLCPHIECKKCRWYSSVDSFHKCALIDNAPTVEPLERIGSICEENCGYRPQGEWIEHHIKGKDFFGNGFICECGRIVMQKENFCPNCGAKMKKGGAE